MENKSFARFLVASGGKGIISVTISSVLFALSVIEHIRGANLTSYVLVCIAALVFSFGAFIAWSEENKKYETEKAKHENPNFQMTISSVLTQYNPNLNLTTVCLSAVLVNSGSPSIAVAWVARYQSPSIDMTIGSVSLPEDEIEWAPVDGKKLVLKRQEMLPARTLTAIERGHARHGRVLFEFPDDRQAEILSGAAQIWLGCHDFSGRLCQQIFQTDAAHKTLGLQIFADEVARPVKELPLPPGNAPQIA